MSMIKGFAGVANGWLKFFVALAAVGWFGLQAVDRLAPDWGSQGVATPAPDEDAMLVSTEAPSNEVETIVNSNATYTSTALPTSTASTSSFANISNEIQSGASSFLALKPTQLALSLFAGLLLGLFGRPGFDWCVEKRRIAAAKRRLRIHERDKQLLAQKLEIAPATYLDDPSAEPQLAQGPQT